ncbi:hypothetical protein QWZ10_14685 [Paracoccus cavernae]|uniref:DUF4148 domain-containing protein n=1 Tax=Paracoccus cavernae TaxID=1571207 RepID=A0ABT8D829_9RHOB|nr:hypothetical protein [Paracoccus cavernae]
MFAKLAVAALALTVAAPAFADTNPGNAMIARLVNVDVNEFNTSELGDIVGEKGSVKQQARARYILEQRARGVNEAVADDSTTNYFGLSALNSRRGHDN